MNALPALSAIATAAVRRQFEATPEPLQTRATTPSWRAGLITLLNRAVRPAIVVGPRPAH